MPMNDVHQNPSFPVVLHNWAAGLIKGHQVLPAGTSLTPEHFKLLCCNNSIQTALIAATERIGTSAHVRHVRLNLQIAALKKRWNHDTTVDTNSCAGQQVVLGKLKVKVIELEAAVAESAKQLTSAADELSTAEHKLSRERQRRLLLESVSTQLEVDTKLCDEQLTQVQAALQQWTNKPPNNQTDVEEEVADVLELRKALLSSDDDTNLKNLKVSVWCRVASRVEERSSAGAVAALARLAREGAARIDRATASVDLRADAAKLHLELTRGGNFRDATMSVRRLVSRVCGAHLEAHLRTTRLRTAADECQQKRNGITATLRQAIQQSPAGSSGGLSAVQTTIAAAGDRAALLALQTVCQRLQIEADAADSEMQDLQQLHHELKAFGDVVVSTHERMQRLSKGVERGWGILEDHRTALLHHASSKVSTLQNHNVVLNRDNLLNHDQSNILNIQPQRNDKSLLQGSDPHQQFLSNTPSPSVDQLVEQIDALSVLPVSCLKRISVEGRGRIQHQQLSITEPQSPLPLITASLDKLLDGYSRVVTPEIACATVCRLHAQLAAHTVRERHADTTHAALRANTSSQLSSQAVKDVCLRVDNNDVSLETGVRDVLATCSAQLQQAENSLPVTQEALNNWWNQPGKVVQL